VNGTRLLRIEYYEWMFAMILYVIDVMYTNTSTPMSLLNHVVSNTNYGRIIKKVAMVPT